MKPFSILDRSLDIHRHYILEASAGTGKTFSIENLVARLLIESDSPGTIDKILVVTFTKAATSELKARIRSQLVKAVEVFRRILFSAHSLEDAPDYLLAHAEKGEEAVRMAIRRLENALACFDEARIFTIHGFCQSMLSEGLFESDLATDAAGTNELLSTAETVQVVRDFFRTMLRPERYSPEQVKRVLKKYRQDVQSLENALCRLMAQGLPIVAPPSYSELLKQFQEAMHAIQKEHAFSSEGIIDDFMLLAPAFTGTCNRQKEIHPELLEQVHSFAAVFEKAEWNADDFDRSIADFPVLFKALDPTKRKAKSVLPPDSALRHPQFLNVMQKQLSSIIQSAGDERLILARMGVDCQQMLDRYLEEKEKFRYDDLLKAMEQAIQHPLFAKKLREQFRAVIIDEFQDTDAVQWTIFDQLFLSEEASSTVVYLVGDPKQSIYGFRNADIYTYLKASQKLGEDYRASLETNYRSQPSLVKALNTLFSGRYFPGLLSLPRIDSALEYTDVHASEKVKSRSFSDDKGSVHFFIGEASKGLSDHWPTAAFEETVFFPFIAEEILKLHEQDGVRFSQWALLVRDRYQGERLAAFLKRLEIPVMTQRQEALTDTLGWSAFRELLYAVIHPHDLSALKQALGGSIIGMTHKELREVSDGEKLTAVYALVYTLRDILYRDGIGAFFQSLMQSPWIHQSESLSASILMRKEGLKLHQELQQIVVLLMEYQQQIRAMPQALLTFLEEGKALEIYEEDQLKVRQDGTGDAVKILTLHTSKGLEFDIVVPIGLITRTTKKEEFIPVEIEGKRQLIAFSDTSEEWMKQHLLEIDAEKMRQLYVAMTRAKYRLYLPVAIMKDRPKKILKGEASSMELFLAHLQRHAGQKTEDLYARIEVEDGQSLYDWLDEVGKQACITYERLDESSCKPKHSAPIVESPSLSPPRTFEIPGKSLFAVSFSSLTSSLSSSSSEQEAKRIPGLAIEKPMGGNPSIHTLPMGPETGNTLHQILEKLPLDLLQDDSKGAELKKEVSFFLKGTELAGWEEVVSEMLHNLFTTPIDLGEDSVRLCDLKPQQTYREMEFLFPCEGFEHPVLNDWQEFQVAQGVLKGVIDFIFSWNGKYYIVDWKSNWLGNGREAYTQPQLERAILEHRYDLQAAIYTEALQRYIHLVDRRPFSDCFGGVLYFFLRGVHPSADKNNGIYCFSRTE